MVLDAHEYAYKDGDEVEVSNLVPGWTFIGFIRGAATTPMWGIGRMWIVEVPDIKSNVYPFSVVSVPETSIKKT